MHLSGNGWESNPPQLLRPDTDFEDQDAHRDITIPTHKNNSGTPNLSTSCKLGFSFLNPKNYYTALVDLWIL